MAIFGTPAVAVLRDDKDNVVWARFKNGNVVRLDMHLGPDVKPGDIIVVTSEDGEFDLAPQELAPSQTTVGNVADVVHLENETVWLRYGSGQLQTLSASAGPKVELGSTVLVADDHFSLAPKEVSLARGRIGVVRLVEESRSLIETDASLTWFSHTDGVTWGQWSTVELDGSTIVRELAPTPIRYRDDPSPETTVKSRFEVKLQGKTETLDEIRGLDAQIGQLRQVMLMAADQNSLISQGIRPIRGVLLSGPPGTGKTMLARALAKETDAAYFHVRGPEIASKWVNEGEEVLRTLLDEADSRDRAIVFFDEIDSIGGNRSDERHEMSNRFITQLLALLDGFETRPNRALILAATNRPESLDPALLRSGRFDKIVEFGLPDLLQRQQILEQTEPTVAEGVDVHRLATITDGWSGSDIRGIWTQAYEFAQSEGRRRILLTDCEVAAERMLTEASLRVGK